MSDVFCPFTKDNQCNSDCVFHDAVVHQDSTEDCQLAEAAKTINSLWYPGNIYDVHLTSIAHSLSSIDGDVGTMQYKVSDIADEIEKMTEDD